MTTLREAAEMALGTLQDVCARLLYRGVSKDPDHPDQIALEQARQTIRALKQATEQFEQKRDPVAWDGWIVREVLFDEGEPVGHREHKPLTDTESDVLTATYMLGLHAGKKATNRQPLTEEQIKPIFDQWKILYGGYTIDLIRAIEQAHGIGGKE